MLSKCLVAGAWLILGVNPFHAAPRVPSVPVVLAYVDGPGAVGVPMAEKVFDFAMGLMRLVGLPVYREKTLWFDAPSVQCLSLAMPDRIACLREWQARITAPKNGAVYVALPPLVGGFLAGISSGTCTIGKSSAVAMGNMRYSSALDIRGYWMSVIAAAHEVGHATGMYHRNAGCKIMHADGLRCVDIVPMPPMFAARSVNDAKSCLAKRVKGKFVRGTRQIVVDEVRQ